MTDLVEKACGPDYGLVCVLYIAKGEREPAIVDLLDINHGLYIPEW